MAEDRGLKHSLSRREGVNFTGTTSPSLQRRLRVPPGQARPQRRQSEYARRLRANRIALGDTIQLTDKAMEIPVVREEIATPPVRLSSWLTREDNVGRVVGLPQREDIASDIQVNLIIEFYSR